MNYITPMVFLGQDSICGVDLVPELHGMSLDSCSLTHNLRAPGII